MCSFNKLSYKRHAEHFRKYMINGEARYKSDAWLRNDSVDAWRHHRMYRMMEPLLHVESGSSWLTVGDGRFGKDSKYIIENGGVALATDISEYLLKEAKNKGYIDDYRVENAESLSFEDDSFDYVLCKESFHHFPRPYLALYEMLRVSRKGVILIEPHDIFMSQRIAPRLIQKIKTLLGRPSKVHSFEECGNYVYSISRREIEKVALGMNYPYVAFSGLNDAYFPGVETEKIQEDGPILKKIKKKLKRSDLLCSMGLKEQELLVAIIFKREPGPELKRKLEISGYNVVSLPKNPYV